MLREVKRFDFIKASGIAVIIGLVFTPLALGLIFLIHEMLSGIGLDCETAWKRISMIAIIPSLFFPIAFYKMVAGHLNDYNKCKNLFMLFVLLEYFSLHWSFCLTVEDAHSLCTSHDGQSGIGLVFSAWFSLPLLFIFGIILDYLQKKHDPR